MPDVRVQGTKWGHRSDELKFVFRRGQKSGVCVDLHRETTKPIAPSHSPTIENARASIESRFACALLVSYIGGYVGRAARIALGTSLLMRRNSGNNQAHTMTTAIVPKPPSTTAGTVPNHCAVIPDSNWPTSLEAPMNTMVTALTLPRISSG